MIRGRLMMDLQMFAGEKTEKATPKKRLDARKKGQVAKSAEIPSALILMAIISTFAMLAPYFSGKLRSMFSEIFQNRLLMEVNAENMYALLLQFTLQLLLFLAPIFAIALIVAFAANYVQFGFLFSLKPLQPKFSALNPLKGLKRIFGLRAVVELVKSLLKLLSVAVVVYLVIMSQKHRFLEIAHMSIVDVFSFAASLVLLLVLFVAGLLLLLAIGDYYYQKYEYEKSLKMSKQDIKDEFKNIEGDPRIKAKIRQKQQRMALMRMMQDVPKADVIITNPTHFAIALQYDSTKMDEPKIVAKGQDYLALRIREIAKQHNVITIENKPLARTLYERTEIGDSVPGDLFQAIAEVLAYVYRLKGRR